MALYLIIQISAALSRVLPRGFRYRVGEAVGSAIFAIWRGGRHRVLRNMATVLERRPDDADVRRVARQSMREYCKYLIEFLELPVMSASDPIITSLRLEPIEYLQGALSEDRGVIIATAHFGTVELGALKLNQFTQFHAVYDAFSPGYLDRLIQRKRRGKGIHLIASDDVRTMIRVLRERGTIAMLFDKPVRKDKGVPVTFFGRETSVPAGPALLALRTGSILLPVYLVRQTDNTFIARLCPPIVGERSGDRERDAQRITQHLMDTLEEAVRQNPEQWYMFRSMWPSEARQPESKGDEASPTSLRTA